MNVHLFLRHIRQEAGVCGSGNAVWPSKLSQRGQHAQQFQRGCDKALMQNEYASLGHSLITLLRPARNFL